jgi:hypothetical protein
MKTIFKSLFLILFSLLLVLIFTETSLRIYGLGNPIIYEKNLVYGYQPKKNQKVKRYRNYNITINSDNFRVYKKYIGYPKEIYFLGDSVTYGGSYIDDENIFSSKTCEYLFKKKLNRSCLNAGVNAYGFENIINRYNYIFEKNTKSHYVITLIPGSFYRNYIQIDSLPYFTKSISNKLLKANIELLAFALDKIRQKIRFNNRISYKENLNSDLKQKIIDDLHLLKNLKDENPKLIILISLSNSKKLNDFNLELEQFILRNSEQMELDIIDIQSKIEKNMIGKIFYDNIHLNKIGHDIYGKILSDLLIDD